VTDLSRRSQPEFSWTWLQPQGVVADADPAPGSRICPTFAPSRGPAWEATTPARGDGPPPRNCLFL